MESSSKYILAFILLTLLATTYTLSQDPSDNQTEIFDPPSSDTIRLESVTQATITGIGSPNTITLTLIINADNVATISSASVNQGYSGTVASVGISPTTLSPGDNLVTILFNSDSTSPFTIGEYSFSIEWNFSGGNNQILTINTTAS